MDTVTPMNLVVDNVTDMIDLFSDVATGDGLAPLLVLIGGLLVVFSMGVFGLLTLGAISSLFSSASS